VIIISKRALQKDEANVKFRLRFSPAGTSFISKRAEIFGGFFIA
jgi:hypothetical protein